MSQGRAPTICLYGPVQKRTRGNGRATAERSNRGEVGSESSAVVWKQEALTPSTIRLLALLSVSCTLCHWHRSAYYTINAVVSKVSQSRGTRSGAVRFSFEQYLHHDFRSSSPRKMRVVLHSCPTAMLTLLSPTHTYTQHKHTYHPRDHGHSLNALITMNERLLPPHHRAVAPAGEGPPHLSHMNQPQPISFLDIPKAVHGVIVSFLPERTNFHHHLHLSETCRDLRDTYGCTLAVVRLHGRESDPMGSLVSLLRRQLKLTEIDIRQPWAIMGLSLAIDQGLCRHLQRMIFNTYS